MDGSEGWRMARGSKAKASKAKRPPSASAANPPAHCSSSATADPPALDTTSMSAPPENDAAVTAAADAEMAQANKVDWRTLPPVQVASPCTTRHAMSALSLSPSCLLLTCFLHCCVRLSVRSRNGVSFRRAPYAEWTAGQSSPADRAQPAADGQLLYSADGAKLAIVTPKDITIVDTETMTDIATIVSTHDTQAASLARNKALRAHPPSLSLCSSLFLASSSRRAHLVFTAGHVFVHVGAQAG